MKLDEARTYQRHKYKMKTKATAPKQVVEGSERRRHSAELASLLVGLEYYLVGLV